MRSRVTPRRVAGAQKRTFRASATASGTSTVVAPEAGEFVEARSTGETKSAADVSPPFSSDKRSRKENAPRGVKREEGKQKKKTFTEPNPESGAALFERFLSYGIPVRQHKTTRATATRIERDQGPACRSTSLLSPPPSLIPAVIFIFWTLSALNAFALLVLSRLQTLSRWLPRRTL